MDWDPQRMPAEGGAMIGDGRRILGETRQGAKWSIYPNGVSIMSLSARREVLSNQSKLQSVVRQQAESQPANVWAMVPGRNGIDFPVTAGNGQMQAISRSAARGQQATTAGLLLHLQRTHGNRYVQRALALSRHEVGEPEVAPG